MEKFEKFLIGLLIFLITIHLIVLFLPMILIFFGDTIDDFIRIVTQIIIVIIINILYSQRIDKQALDKRNFEEYKKSNKILFNKQMILSQMLAYIVYTLTFLIFSNCIRTMVSIYYDYNNNIFLKILLSKILSTLISICVGLYALVTEPKEIIYRLRHNFE